MKVQIQSANSTSKFFGLGLNKFLIGLNDFEGFAIQQALRLNGNEITTRIKNQKHFNISFLRNKFCKPVLKCS